MWQALLRYKATLIGMAAGAIGGYAYWFYVGCASGTCAITSKPLNSILYGALVGALIAGLFNNKKTKK